MPTCPRSVGTEAELLVEDGAGCNPTASGSSSPLCRSVGTLKPEHCGKPNYRAVCVCVSVMLLLKKKIRDNLRSTKRLMPLSIRNMIGNAVAYGVLRYAATKFEHSTNLQCASIDATSNRILRSVAYITQCITIEDLFSARELHGCLSLLRRTMVLKYCWSDAFQTYRQNVRFFSRDSVFYSPASV